MSAGRGKLEVPIGAIRDVFTQNMEVFTKFDLRYLQFGDSRARINLETGSFDAVLEKRVERTPIPRFFMKWSIIRGLERRNRCPLHSSAVTDGTCIRIFVGRSGAGKTTLLMLHLVRGQTLLTDDVLFLGQGAIYPFLLRSDLREETCNRLRRESKFASIRLKPGLVDLGAIFPSRRDRLQLDKVSLYYLNVWRSSRSKIQHVTPQRMLGLLTDSYVSEMNQSYWSGWKTGKRISNVMRAYSEILRYTDCYEIRGGSDLTHLYNLIQRTKD